MHADTSAGKAVQFAAGCAVVMAIGQAPLAPGTHEKEITMSVIKERAAHIIAVSTLAFGVTACSTWDSMSSRQRSTVGGAAVGGVVGAVVTDGSVLGTVGGAALGGIAGDQLDRHSNRNRRRR